MLALAGAAAGLRHSRRPGLEQKSLVRLRLIVSRGNAKQHSGRNEIELKVLTLVSFLLIGYLVSGQQPFQDKFRRVVEQVTPLPQGDARLLLTGATVSPEGRTAVINGRVVAQGEIASLVTAAGPTTIKVLKVEKNGVTVLIEGEHGPRFLVLK